MNIWRFKFDETKWFLGGDILITPHPPLHVPAPGQPTDIKIPDTAEIRLADGTRSEIPGHWEWIP